MHKMHTCSAWEEAHYRKIEPAIANNSPLGNGQNPLCEFRARNAASNRNLTDACGCSIFDGATIHVPCQEAATEPRMRCAPFPAGSICVGVCFMAVAREIHLELVNVSGNPITLAAWRRAVSQRRDGPQGRLCFADAQPSASSPDLQLTTCLAFVSGPDAGLLAVLTAADIHGSQ
jgi:hypothetical protein